MKIEAITICVNYSDYLAHTILFNKQLFQRMIVVTDCSDRRTRDLCEHHHVQCISTDVFYGEDGEKAFDKGAGIRYGLNFLQMDGWVAHIDADIALPPRTSAILPNLGLDPAFLYGLDRMMCPNFDAWAKYVSQPDVQHSCDAFISPGAFPLGHRLGLLNGGDGYIPLGFFQLWNPQASGVTDYPSHGSAARSDVRFALQWPRAKRHLLPEVLAVHLETERGEVGGHGLNWRGRRSPHFGEQPPPPKPYYERKCDPTPLPKGKTPHCQDDHGTY